MQSVALLLGAVATLASTSAVAQPDDDGPRTDRVAPGDVSGSLLMGVWNGGFMLGGTALARYGHVEVGAEVIDGPEILDYTYLGLAADAGLAWRTASGWRFDAYGAIGGHRYADIEAGKLGPGDPGASATLPFVGMRVRTGYVFGKGPAHFELGLLGFFEDDLDREPVSYECDGAPATYRVGTARYGAALSLAFSYDSW